MLLPLRALSSEAACLTSYVRRNAGRYGANAGCLGLGHTALSPQGRNAPGELPLLDAAWTYHDVYSVSGRALLAVSLEVHDDSLHAPLLVLPSH